MKERGMIKIGGGGVSPDMLIYKKPSKSDELSGCEYIDKMEKAYFQPPKQSAEKCYGYRNQYTGQASKVCETCEWFSDKKEVVAYDGSGTD